MDANPNEAAGESNASQTEANQTNSNQGEQNQPAEQAQQPDMQGFTSEQLADMKKFFDANGGYDKVKSRISNPPKAEEKQSEPQVQQPQQQQQPQTQQPAYQPPEGSITANEFMAQQYFQGLSHEEKYAPIAKEIADGSVLKEMSEFGIQAMNQDGSLNDKKVRMYLDLRAKTVPAQPTGTEPNASSAPTVDYVQAGENLNADEAYKILSQDAELKRAGLAGHPRIADAEAFIKSQLNPNAQNNSGEAKK